MRVKYYIFFLGLFFLNAEAQQQHINQNSIKDALDQKEILKQNTLVKQVPFKSIGPTVMSGRVVDLAVNPEDPNEFYVGYASGGVWHTTNNGTSFKPILDASQTQNVGDIAVHWASRTIWVGTGENNASRSSYSGIGLLKSSDNGKTWQHAGLLNSQHIGRILINPNNENEVVVGVTGALYSENETRGIYKSSDGGKTWKRTLFVDNKTGIIDLQHSPNNFNVMFASAWEKERKAWNFNGSGKNSAIYKTVDAGNTWSKVSVSGSGFPTGAGVGRIGLALYDDNTIYAILDNQNRRDKTKEKTQNGKLTKDDFKTMSKEACLDLDDKALNLFLKQNGFQEKYSAENVKQLIRSNTIKPIDLAHYLENANSLLFDTPVIGAEVYKSSDGGKTWKKTHADFLDDLYYSYGYYFGHIYVSPKHEDHIYIYGVPILKSKDGGKTYTSINKENVHADHHALWINPKNPNHLINGNDGGVNITYDDGEHWIKNNSLAVGQFYSINVDNETPYNVYGGLQDNGVWVGTHNAEENARWHQTGQYPWKSIMGGDGMQIQIDNRDANIVYTGYQFGNYYRLNRATKDMTYIQPKHELGDRPYRFNWQTPILLSSHNQDILYLGGNKLMRSMDQGDHWQTISNDLTQGGKKGNVAYGTLTTISESPFQFGLLYTGSDDGLIQISKNSGSTWSVISSGLPPNLWVSRVVASRHKKERVYATLNGYRFDDFKSYVYVSEDYGATWKSIASQIPASPVNVIKEDPVNENILYLGTDNGAYVSLDKGASWQAFSENLPAVAVHDIVLQERTNDLLLGTHGRSIYVANMSPIQSYVANEKKEGAIIFKPENVKYSSRWGSSWSNWSKPNIPEVNLVFYSDSAGIKEVKIVSKNNKLLNTIKVNAEKGFNYQTYDLRLTEAGKKALEKYDDGIIINTSKDGNYYLPKGTYWIKIDNATQELIID